MTESGKALVSRRTLIRNGLLVAGNMAWTPVGIQHRVGPQRGCGG